MHLVNQIYQHVKHKSNLFSSFYVYVLLPYYYLFNPLQFYIHTTILEANFFFSYKIQTLKRKVRKITNLPICEQLPQNLRNSKPSKVLRNQ